MRKLRKKRENENCASTSAKMLQTTHPIKEVAQLLFATSTSPLHHPPPSHPFPRHFNHPEQRGQNIITSIRVGRRWKKGGDGRGYGGLECGGLFSYHIYFIYSPIAAILLFFTQTPVSHVVAACTSNLLQVSISVFSSEATYHLKLFLKQSRFKMG